MTSDTGVTGTEATPLEYQRLAWAMVWRGGGRESLMCDAREASGVMLFGTRDAARRYVRERYCYIAKRPDLRQPPHEWRVPRVVRVRVIVEEVR